MASATTLPSFFIIFTLLPLITHSIPFVVFHGIADSCTKKGVTHFTDRLSNWSNSQGYCIEIGNGVWDSWFMPFAEQTEIACEKVKSMSELSEGYNIVGLSQGNLVGRGVLEFCDGAPPVRNFISVAGPHAGEASIPFCGSGVMCIILDSLMKLAIYSKRLQEHLAPSNYIKIPTDLDGYREGCTFLPKLNNEFEKNATYKERFTSLQKLVLIMFDGESVLVPKETSWFGYFPDGAWDPILPAQEVWRVAEAPEDDKFQYTYFAHKVNSFDSAPKKLLASDCRLRPDRYALEMGDLSKAGSEKSILEEKQRAEKRIRESRNHEFIPKWFDMTDQIAPTPWGELEIYEYNGQYAKHRAAADKSSSVEQVNFDTMEFNPWQYGNITETE